MGRSAWRTDAGPRTTASTPIPPPATLPSRPGGPAEGRRFSAADIPDEEEFTAARRVDHRPTRALAEDSTPRRPSRALADADRTPSRAMSADDDTGPSRALPRERPRRRRRWVLAASSFVVVAVGVGLAYLFLRPPAGTATTDPSIDPVATYLLQPNDLTALRKETTWSTASTDTSVQTETPQPACFLAAGEIDPAPQASLVRTFTPDSGSSGALLHQVDLYPSEEEAQAAYAARVSQLASCQRQTAFLRSAASVDGLADEATSETFVIQDTRSEYHTFVVSRTGARVNVVDATQPDDPVNVTPVATVLAEASKRQCTDTGTCPTTLEVKPAAPQPVNPAGWLADVDFPRLNPGAGAWRGTDVAEMSVVGSRCEAIDFDSVEKQTSAAQRTYLIADDSAVPAGFGVDQVVYTFATEDDAVEVTKTLAGNVNDCADRVPTAEVKRVGNISTGSGTGSAWLVLQQTGESSSTARFRVTVLQAGNHIVYLMANPNDEVDFSDEEWIALSKRAAQRATQG
ncbi:MAG: hypothetical protein ACK5LS_13980 [Propioniciclava sp.]